VTCSSPGQYYDAAANGCVSAGLGFYVARKVTYFYDSSTEPWIDDKWTTGCFGVCGSNGWRFRSDRLESGFLFPGHSDSWANLVAQITSNYASIQFNYQSQTAAPSGLLFLIDGVGVPLNQANIESSITIPLSTGFHNFTWILHQEAGTSLGWATIRNVAIIGSDNGPTFPYPCPRGTYNNQTDSLECNFCAPGQFAPDTHSVRCEPCQTGTYTSKYGSTSCTYCKSGTYTPDKEADHCITDCRYEGLLLGKEVLYDLSRLNQLYGPTPDENRNSYTISPCQLVNCPYNHQTTNVESHVCVDTPVGLRDGGNILSYTSFNDSGFGFMLQYSEGDPNGCGVGVQRSVSIGFQCDLTKGHGNPSFLSYSGNNCTSLFLWASSFACPICGLGDFTTITGPCEKGKRTVVKQRTGICNDQGVGATNYYTENCTALEIPVSLIVGLVSAFFIAILIIAVVALRNRSLTQRYQRLMESDVKATGIEMEEEEHEHDLSPRFSIEGKEEEQEPGNE